jgi:hypothetical protein
MNGKSANLRDFDRIVRTTDFAYISESRVMYTAISSRSSIARDDQMIRRAIRAFSLRSALESDRRLALSRRVPCESYPLRKDGIERLRSSHHSAVVLTRIRVLLLSPAFDYYTSEPCKMRPAVTYLTGRRSRSAYKSSVSKIIPSRKILVSTPNTRTIRLYYYGPFLLGALQSLVHAEIDR